MNVPPVSVERVQKCVVNFEIYRFLKKAANLPHPPLLALMGIESGGRGTRPRSKKLSEEGPPQILIFRCFVSTQICYIFQPC